MCEIITVKKRSCCEQWQNKFGFKNDYWWASTGVYENIFDFWKEGMIEFSNPNLCSTFKWLRLYSPYCPFCGDKIKEDIVYLHKCELPERCDDHTSVWGGAGPDCINKRLVAATL